MRKKNKPQPGDAVAGHVCDDGIEEHLHWCVSDLSRVTGCGLTPRRVCVTRLSVADWGNSDYRWCKVKNIIL